MLMPGNKPSKCKGCLVILIPLLILSSISSIIGGLQPKTHVTQTETQTETPTVSDSEIRRANREKMNLTEEDCQNIVHFHLQLDDEIKNQQAYQHRLRNEDDNSILDTLERSGKIDEYEKSHSYNGYPLDKVTTACWPPR